MLEASHLKKIYETGSEKVYALDDVSFRWKRESLLRYLDRQDAGKSTFSIFLEE